MAETSEATAAPAPSTPKIGLSCPDKAVAETILKSLQGAGYDLAILEPTIDATRAAAVEGLIQVFTDPPEPSVRFFAQCMEKFPHMPVLGVSNLDAMHVIELLKCGMSDHMTPPLDGEVLRRKLKRMLARESGTVLDSAVLGVLPKSDQLESKRQKRTCARSDVFDQFPARVAVAGVMLKVVDISVLTDDAPGGLGLLADPVATKKLPLSQWTSATMVQIGLHVPAEICAQPIPGRARVVRISPRPPLGTSIAFQYWLDRLRDESLVQRFWMKCQLLQRNAAMAKPAAAAAAAKKK